MNLGTIIKNFRSQKKLTMQEFATMSNLSKAYISMLEKGIRSQNNKTIAPSLKTVSKIANAMHLTLDELLKMLDDNQLIGLNSDSSYEKCWDEQKTSHNSLVKEEEFKYTVNSQDNIFPLEMKRFPLLGEIACGKPIFANEDRESYIMAGTDINADFCLKAKGDSMINARILDGDIVFIKQDVDIVNGDIYAVIIEDEATLKRLYLEKDVVSLVAENPAYKPIIYTGSDMEKLFVLGKAVAFQSDVK